MLVHSRGRRGDTWDWEGKETIISEPLSWNAWVKNLTPSPFPNGFCLGLVGYNDRDSFLNMELIHELSTFQIPGTAMSIRCPLACLPIPQKYRWENWDTEQRVSQVSEVLWVKLLLFAPTLRGNLSRWGKDMRSRRIQSGKLESNERWYSALLSPFGSSRTLELTVVLSHIEDGSCHPSDAYLEASPQTYPVVCLFGDPKFCHVDHKYKWLYPKFTKVMGCPCATIVAVFGPCYSLLWICDMDTSVVWMRMAPQAHTFECFFVSWWTCLRNIRRCGLVGERKWVSREMCHRNRLWSFKTCFFFS